MGLSGTNRVTLTLSEPVWIAGDLVDGADLMLSLGDSSRVVTAVSAIPRAEAVGSILVIFSGEPVVGGQDATVEITALDAAKIKDASYYENVMATGTYLVSPMIDAAPVLEPIADQACAEGDTVSLQVLASDPDGDSLSFSAEGLPEGLSIDPGTGGTISYTAAGVHTVTVIVTDSTPTTYPAADRDTRSFTWTVTNINRSPAFTAATTNTNQDITEGMGLSALTATDPDGDQLMYTLADGVLPAGISLNPDGTFGGTASHTAQG